MKFDIILPTTGRESLREAIQSVWKQSYSNWRLFITCDGCQPIMLPFDSEEDLRLVCVPADRLPRNQLPHNDSGAWARNRGIQEGFNQWIAYIDDDDVWLPNHLTTLVSLSTLNPEANMLRTAGQSFAWKHKSPRSKKLVRKLGAINSSDILTVGMAHTRDLFERTSGWKPEDNHDKILWQEMLSLGGKPAVTEQVTFQFAR